ncbi:hypothetical protein B0O99DRAFT_519737 [Bisporella sp. PMI_857]|nr:hypothetical protein B0O99DRAFT_519737 [Bisporella sp. PMI_857]
MASLLNKLFPCIPVHKAHIPATNISEKACLLATDVKGDEAKATEILNILFNAEKEGKALRDRIEKEVSTTGWKDSLAVAILTKFEEMLDECKPMAQTMTDAYLRAKEGAEIFVSQHPVLAGVLLTVIAIGVLYILLPWVIEVLGFAEAGPVEGSWAALWQSRIGNIPAGSWFSFFQRLGMKIHRL